MFLSLSCSCIYIDISCLGTGKDYVLTWESRVKILRDCAAALKYLHHHISGCIVHRDIKVQKLYINI